MKKVLSLLLVLVMVFAMFGTAFAADAPVAAAPAVTGDYTGKAVILHTNDIHGAVEGYAKIAALKAEYEAAGAQVILVDAGDFIQGTTYVSVSEGATAVELMNLVGYDIATLGNHEFDYGYANLVSILEDAEFAVTSNISYEGELVYEDSIVVELDNGLSLALVGLTTPETSTKAHPAKIKGVTFPAAEELYTSAQAAVDALDADVVIALSHLGVDAESAPNRSYDVWNNVTGFDFIIDGHSHTVMTEGENGEPIQSTGTKAAYVGVIVIGSEGIEDNSLFDLSTYTVEDDAVKSASDAIVEEIQEIYGAVFATTEVLLDGNRSPGVRTQNTNLGDLIADALLWQATKDGGLSVDDAHVVAITNGGGIRATINAGDITMNDINTVLPFGNTVAIVYVTGAELLEVLEASTYCTPDAVGAFPQTAGIKYTLNTAIPYDANAETYPGSTYYGPASIKRISIESINGQPFDKDATYAIVTNDFLAAGGDTYYAFTVAEDIMDTGIPMDEAVMSYITQVLGGVITAEKYGAPRSDLSIVNEPVVVPGVTEMTVAGNTVFVYAPESELTVSSTCTAPAFMVFGAAPFTAESALADARESGLGALAAAEGATIVYINPQGESWGEADLGVYSGLIDMYSNSSTNVYVNGIAEEFNFFTGDTATKILGDTGRVYIYGIGPGADFVAANLMKKVVASVTYPDGFTMTFDRTPTSVTLIAPSAIPAATEPADIAVAIVEGPADAAEKLAGLTDKVLISDEEIDVVYDKLSGAWRRQVGILLPMIDWAAEGITETVVTRTAAVTDSMTGETAKMPYHSVVYYANDLNVNDPANPVPLVLTFHGGGNTALYQAQASEWPLIGKANGFITVAVDNHTALTATHIAELVEYLKTVYAIDASRVYASGFSMGSVKSWDLFEQYPTLFAGLAPMSGSFVSATGDPSGYMMPVFYVGGEASPLPELCNQGEDIINRVGYTLKANKISDSYTYNAETNLFWGVNGDIVYQVSDKAAFKDSVLTINLFKSEDGHYYTALASAGNMSHEVYARNSWAAWDFLKQFSRAADGSIVIEEVNYTLTSDDGKVSDNSYNTAAATSASYTVVKGDTLWGIATKLLGSGSKWSAIYEANKGIIANPNIIFVGQTFVIPGETIYVIPGETIETPAPSEEPARLQDPYIGTWTVHGFSLDGTTATFTAVVDQKFIFTDSTVEYTIGGVSSGLWNYTAEASTDGNSDVTFQLSGPSADTWYFANQADGSLLIYDAALFCFYHCTKDA